MLAPSTTGVNRSSTRRIARLASEHACRGTGTHIAVGQSRRACAIDIADRTPNARVSYDAEHTTPRLPGRPPTMSSCALPAPPAAGDERCRVAGAAGIDRTGSGEEEGVGMGEENARPAKYCRAETREGR